MFFSNATFIKSHITTAARIGATALILGALSGAAQAQTSSGCTAINAGSLNLTSQPSSTVSTSLFLNQGDVIAAVLTGAITNSLLVIGSQTLFSTDTSGIVNFTVAVASTYLILADIHVSGIGALTLTCTAAAEDDGDDDDTPSDGDDTPGDETDPGTKYTSTPYLLSLDLLDGTGVTSLYVEEAEDLLSFEFGKVDRIPEIIARIDRLKLELDAMRRRHLPMDHDDYFVNNENIKDAVREIEQLEIELENAQREYSVISEIGGITPLGYSPEAAIASGPLAAFNAINRTARHAIIQNKDLRVWTEVGVVHHAGGGNSGQSGLAAGGMIGLAARASDNVALTGTLYAGLGRFGASTLGLTGDFTEVGATAGAVIRLTDELFFALGGLIAQTQLNQTVVGVTSSYTVQKYRVNTSLSGHFYVDRFRIDPDVSASWTYATNHTVRVSAGGKISTPVQPSANLPVLTPFVTAHGNWTAASDADFSGLSLNLGTGVEMPLGDMGSINMAVNAMNLFSGAGTLLGGTIGVHGNW